MANDFADRQLALDSPAQSGYAVSPSDTTDFDNAFRALYVGGAGDVEVVTVKGDVLLFKSVPAGTFLPVSGIRVNDTNTDATFMLGLY